MQIIYRSHEPLSPGFNGATSRRTWNVSGVSLSGLIVRHCFNGATSRRTWNARYDRFPASISFCFNGATSRRTWNAKEDSLENQKEFIASMEPRPGGRGMT